MFQNRTNYQTSTALDRLTVMAQNASRPSWQASIEQTEKVEAFPHFVCASWYPDRLFIFLLRGRNFNGFFLVTIQIWRHLGQTNSEDLVLQNYPTHPGHPGMAGGTKLWTLTTTWSVKSINLDPRPLNCKIQGFGTLIWKFWWQMIFRFLRFVVLSESPRSGVRHVCKLRIQRCI